MHACWQVVVGVVNDGDLVAAAVASDAAADAAAVVDVDNERCRCW